MLGRLAAVMAGGPRPKIVHTYHGHVLEGYFGPVKNATYRGLERRLASVSDALIGVSGATVDDLVRLGDRAARAVPRDPDRPGPGAVPRRTPRDGAEFRAEAGVREGEVLLTFVGRLVPIKRVDVLLRAVAHARSEGAPVRLAVVGDGELRPELEALAAELGVAGSVWFAGYRARHGAGGRGLGHRGAQLGQRGHAGIPDRGGRGGDARGRHRVGGVPDVVTPGSGLLALRAPVWPRPGEVTRAGDGDARRRMGARLAGTLPDASPRAVWSMTSTCSTASSSSAGAR